jgi:sulfoxide reductase heme-binding subunit YedZ
MTRDRRILLAAALAGLACVVGLGLAVRAGLVPAALPDPRPEGPLAWRTSRALGLTAFVALTLEIALGLGLAAGVTDRLIARARVAVLHDRLSLGALALVAAHAVALLGDRWLRFDVVDLVVPFAARVRGAGVALGVIAAWIAVVVHASVSLRGRLGARWFRWVHRLAFVAWVAVVAHGVGAGTDTRSPFVAGLYLASASLVGALFVVRVVRRRSARARA